MAGAIEVAVQFIKFDCEKCGQPIQAPAEGEGLDFECPSCKEQLTIPKISSGVIRTSCPRCGQKLKMPPEGAGTEIACPVCSHGFLAPDRPNEKKALHLPKVPVPPIWAFALVAVCFLVAGVGWYYRWTKSPAYTIRQIQKALAEHDYVSFQRYVDVDSVISRLLDDVLALNLSEAGDDDTGAAFGAGMVKLMKPRLVDEAKQQVSRFVEGGGSGGTNADFGKFDDVEKAQKFLGVVHDRREGKTALIGIAFTNSQERVSHVIELRLRSKDGGWQVAEISNVRELSREVMLEQQMMIARENAPARAKIAKLLEVTNVSKRSGPGKYGIGKEVVIGLTVRNIGEVPIESYSAVIRTKAPSGGVMKEVRVRDDDLIPAKEIGSGTWKFDVNDFVASDRALYKAEITVADVQVVRIKCGNSPEILVRE
jgi:DNA-directed RNA polymerase subunit RPC12/RpoP